MLIHHILYRNIPKLFLKPRFIFSKRLITTSKLLNVPTGEPGSLITKDNVKEHIYTLRPGEREVLLEELQAFKEKEKVEKHPVAPPNFTQLKFLFLCEFLPFIGFGFCDNFIMITSGNYIETKLGVVFSITTMAAAGLGNALSDIVGIGATFYIEKVVGLLGIQVPALTPGQTTMKRTRLTINLGRILGVTFGCIIGMCPLLFKEESSGEKDPKKQPSPPTEPKKT